LDQKEKKLQEAGEDCTMISFITCTLNQILLGDKVKGNEVGRSCSTHRINLYNALVRKPAWKNLLGIPRHRWEDNIRTDFREIVWEGVDWIHLAQDWDERWALMNMVKNLQTP
jgi:hypothetical protein